MEWLSDWSFNVVFEDDDDAGKAMAAKSFALPNPLPASFRVSVHQDGDFFVGSDSYSVSIGTHPCHWVNDAASAS